VSASDEEIRDLRQRLIKSQELQAASDEHTRKVLEENKLLKKAIKDIAIFQCIDCDRLRLNPAEACTCGGVKAVAVKWSPP